MNRMDAVAAGDRHDGLAVAHRVLAYRRIFFYGLNFSEVCGMSRW